MRIISHIIHRRRGGSLAAVCVTVFDADPESAAGWEDKPTTVAAATVVGLVVGGGVARVNAVDDAGAAMEVTTFIDVVADSRGDVAGVVAPKSLASTNHRQKLG